MITKFIGKTPLIKLNYFSEISGCNIFGKAEFMNPGGSVKDRAAKYIIEHALEKILLKKVGLLLRVQQAIQVLGLL